jgi:hypothetical protein
LFFLLAIVRPKYETEITIQDRHPTLILIDLLKDYETILPPTIARKKRESERKIPLRKRTAPMDMRIHRSRLSTGIDPKQLLAAQHAAQQGGTKSPPPVPPVPSIPGPPPVVQSQPIPPPPLVAPQPIPPPPQLVSPSPPPPPAKPSDVPEAPAIPSPLASVPAASDLPPRPSFKTPPPEDDDLPPRPTFKEPPPELEEIEAPPRPEFVEPLSEPSSPPSAPSSAPSSAGVAKLKRSGNSRPASPSAKAASRSPSPPADQTLSNVKSSITRSSSSGLRGPRLTRGPRAPTSAGGVNRNSIAGSPPPTSPNPKRHSGGSNHGSRPSSVLGRSSAFSRRTMASDAEDEVVDK